MLVELHMLQNFPPSCLNRDDTNAPKTVSLEAAVGPASPASVSNAPSEHTLYSPRQSATRSAFARSG